MIARALTAMISGGKKYIDADGNSFFRRIGKIKNMIEFIPP